MGSVILIGSSFGVSVIGVAWLWPCTLWAILFAAILIASMIFGFCATLTAYMSLSTLYSARRCLPLTSFSDFHKYITDSYQLESSRSPQRLPVVFGRSVDIALQDLLDLIVRDLLSPWLHDLALFPQSLQIDIKSDMWFVLGRLRERFTDVDETKLIAVDMVAKITHHFELIRTAQTQSNGMPGQFYLSSHLCSRDKELAHLRKIAELIVITLFPRTTVHPSVNRTLLIEILTCQVLAPCVDLLTDPDYINLKLVEYVEQLCRNQHLHGMSFAHAESYDDFIQLIRVSDSVDYLKHIRYTIMTEIMQATTIQNLKKVKGEEEPIRERNWKEDGKKLPRYLGQLTYAKSQCESRLRALESSAPNDLEDGSLRRTVPLQAVLESGAGRKRIRQFLELSGSGEEALLSFWVAVEQLKAAEKKNWHQIGAEIYYTFLHSPLSVIKVEKAVRRKIESFLLGDSGPDVFYEVQETVLEKLRNKIYPAFLVSDLYLIYLQDVDKTLNSTLNYENPFIEDVKDKTVLEHSGFARGKLSQLEDRLSNKSQALQALRSSLKPESKVLSGLEKEVETLQGQIRQLETHLLRTEAWAENLGKWRASVQSVQAHPDKGPEFVLVVHVMEDDHDADAVSTGWVVLRNLVEFHDLHRKLCQLWSGTKQLELPSQSHKFLFGKQLDKASCEKAKTQVDKYLENILMEDQLNACEPLYAFLSPSSEHMKINFAGADLSGSPKKSRFSFTTLFKSAAVNSQGVSEGSRESDEELSLMDDGDGDGAAVTDAVAEPLHALLGEVFDLRGVFRWLRRTLIAFVQITYGRSISRQVAETVAWLISEPMLHYYIQQLMHAWWPEGKLVRPTVLRTPQEKALTREEARMAVSSNTPDVLNNLVGAENARRGVLKLFETLQDVRLNKQIFYELLELVLYELYPELQRRRGPGGARAHPRVRPVSPSAANEH